MPGLQDLLAAVQQQQPQAPQQQMPQPQGQNPLSAIAPQFGQQQQPQPTAGQTAAAVHRFGEIKQAMRGVMGDPNLGKTNIRPKLLDAASKLLASKVVSLPEIMNAIKGLPDDPFAQRNFVDKLYTNADQAQKLVLSHHRNAKGSGEGEEPYGPDNHQAMMDGLMQHYGGRNG